MHAKHATLIWLVSIGLICAALLLFGVSWQVAVGVWLICAALRLASAAAAVSRRPS